MAASLAMRAEVVNVSSPNGRYAIAIDDSGDYPRYSVEFDGKQVIAPSRLDIKWNGEGPTRRDPMRVDDLKGMKIAETTTESCDSAWAPAYGERAEIPERYNGARISLRRESDRWAPIAIDARAYDEGVALRYTFAAGSYLRILAEGTEFALPEGSMAWHTPRAQTVYSRIGLSDWPGEAERPLLIELPDGRYACLGEAGVVDYVRTKFTLSDERPNTVLTSMYGEAEDIAPYSTPWRLVMCGNSAGEILENNYIYYNLNAPAAFDASWIHPGKMMRETTLSTEGALSCIDFAKRHGISYLLFDTGWYGVEASKDSDATTVSVDPRKNPNPDCLDMQKVVAKADSAGIGVVLYVNQRALQQQLDSIIPTFKRWGIAGIKFGFVRVGSQVWTKWMHDAVRKCGEAGLLVDIHDEYRPTGASRTYPNLMTQEGIRGNEEFPDAEQNSILPFTRYVCGPADYTICYYRQDFDRLAMPEHGAARPKSIQNTPAHQLALSVVYYSPMQVLYWYDKPSDSREEPELKFFDDVPTVWDETRVLEGRPGEYATVARRKGDDWFVGSINGSVSDWRQAEIALPFLGEGKYKAEVYEDGSADVPTRTKVVVSEKKVKKGDKLKFKLRPSGGVAIRISKAEI
ncbi:MAG: glycoside hydrolase family 97 protein [Clostridium sp.]|nr:glycoside hydrolase family 97 protein [Clostridium sp.]